MPMLLDAQGWWLWQIDILDEMRGYCRDSTHTIGSPHPLSSLNATLIFLHECGHSVLSHRGAGYFGEIQAWAWAVGIWKRYGFEYCKTVRDIIATHLRTSQNHFKREAT